MNIETNLLMMLRLDLTVEDNSKVKGRKHVVIKKKKRKKKKIFCLEIEFKICPYG